MKRKHWAILCVFSLLCAVLPFVVQGLYVLGDSYPLIETRFSESDVLGYLSSTMGLLVSMIALFVAMSSQEVNLAIRHGVTNSDSGNIGILIEIQNKNNFDCYIHSLELCNKKKKFYAHVGHIPPMTIPAMGTQEVVVEVEDIQDILHHIPGSRKHKRIQYCIRVSLDSCVYLPSKELYQIIKNIYRAKVRAYSRKR